MSGCRGRSHVDQSRIVLGFACSARAWVGGVVSGSVLMVILSSVFVVFLSCPGSASASSKVITENMSGIVEWVYRNGAVADPLPCEAVCKGLWTAEHGPPSAGAQVQVMWDELGDLETTGTNLWGPISELRDEMGEVKLGPVPLKVGLEVGYGGPDPKWMEITGPTEPVVPSPACGGGWGTIFQSVGQEIGTTFYEKAYSHGNEWYLAVCGVSEIVASLAYAENPSEPGERCGAGGWSVPGWRVQEWQWNRCGEGLYKGEEIWSPMIAQGFYQQFNFSRPEDWTHQEIPSGEYVHNNEWINEASDPGISSVEIATESALKSGAFMSKWLEWQLEGEHGPNPLTLTPEEEYGSSSEAAPDRPKCFSGHPVNCATGNQTETQTDLSVGGRGPGLHLTRTYNSQLAAKQTSPGPFGYGWTGPYSAHLEVNEEQQQATVHQSNGSTVRFLYSGEKWVPAAPLVQATLAKEGSNYIYTLPNQTALHFNGSGEITSETDRNGNSITMSYNAKKQLEAVTDEASRKLTFTYNSEGLVTSAKDPMGHTVKYTYETGRLATVMEPGETKANWKFKYDASHQMTEEVDGRGDAIKTEYDTSHRVTSQTDALSRKREWKYASTETGSETTITEPNGSTTVEAFNVAGEPTSVTHASGTSLAQTTKNEYDSSYNLVAITDPSGHTVKYAYDSEGNRTAETDALGHVTEWTYDATHDVVAAKTPDGETTTITRDSHGNAETISRLAPGETTQVTRYKYDFHGDLESATDPLERTTKYEYDSKGDRTAEIDPEGDKRTWEYNEDSQEVATVSPRGNVSGGEPTKYTTKIERDQRGREIKVTDPLSHATKYTYDAAGNRETVTDANSHKTKYTYDADNELTKTEEPNATIIETGYDSEGQITSQTDGNKDVTKYVRNALEQVTEIIDPRERKTTKEYDSAGNLIKLTDATSRTITYTYNADNQLVEVSYSDGKTHAAKYEYNGDGKLTHMTDGTGETTNTYDQLDRLTETRNGHGETTGYEYDLANQLVKITYPNGKTVTRAYDKAGRLEKVSDWLEHTTKFAYDADSDLSSITFPTGTSNEDKYTYNAADQMSEIKMLKGSETLASLVYTRDSDGQLKKTTSKGLPGEEKPEFVYDADNRLTKAGATVYEYSPANNPTKIGTGTYTYSKASELETGPNTTYTYNEVGQRIKTTPTTGSATTYGYDQAGNLLSVERPKEGEKAAIEDAYTYDGDDLRASQTTSGTTTYLAWATNEAIPLLLSDGTNSYIYGPNNAPVEQVNGEKVLYLHHDQQGSTRLLTNSTGAKEATFTYDAFGNQTGHTGTATTPLGYNGQYTNSDTGLIYLRARVYDPATAQFLSVDPLVGSTRAPYDYAADNPLNESDPTGLGNWLDLGIPSPGEVLEPLNPIKYYEEEISDYEDGCGYWGSVEHGIEGAVVGTLDATGLDGAGEDAVRIAEGSAEHIFRDAAGHLAEDTPENRALIEGAVKSANYVDTHEPGVSVYRENLPNGTQVWAEVYKGEITNAGVNQTPR